MHSIYIMLGNYGKFPGKVAVSRQVESVSSGFKWYNYINIDWKMMEDSMLQVIWPHSEPRETALFMDKPIFIYGVAQP